MLNTPPKIFLPNQSDSALVTPDTDFLRRFRHHNIDTGRSVAACSPEDADLIILFQEWSFKLPNYREQLLKDKLVQEFAKKLYVVNYDSVVSEGYLPGCYVSLQQSLFDPTRFRPCAYPKFYNEHFKQPESVKKTPDYLYSFRGTLHSHPLRKKMLDALPNNRNAKIVDNTKAFHTHTNDEKEQYLKELMASLFVLCPRGSSPNSYRLYETMSLGRCPVIISDEWVETTGPDWQQCSIRIKESDIGHIDSILKERESDGVMLGENARQAWHTHFSEENTYKSYLTQILDLHESQASCTKSFEQYRKHWNSHEFMRSNGWSLRQKIARRVKKLWPR